MIELQNSSRFIRHQGAESESWAMSHQCLDAPHGVTTKNFQSLGTTIRQYGPTDLLLHILRAQNLTNY